MQLAFFPPDEEPVPTVAVVTPAPIEIVPPGPGDWRAGLRTRWAAGAAADVGRALAAALAPERRPPWAAGVLALLAPLAPAPIAGVESALALAADAGRWSEADALALTLGAQRARAERGRGARPLRAALLGMAESLAQLAYAAGGGLAPFTSDGGARVTALARELVERAGDPALEARVWRALSAHLA